MAEQHPYHHMATSDLFLSFGLMPLPDAIDTFRFWSAEHEHPGGVELYALRLFDEIDLKALRGAYDACEVRLAFISRMNAFYLKFDSGEVDPEQERALLQAETVVNRLMRLLDRIGEAEPSEEACSVLDQRAFQRVVGEAQTMLQAAGSHNPWACPGTVRCAPGGEWDVRTRIARACEGFSPITRLDYNFACDAAAGLVAMRLTCPDEVSMPHSYCDEDTACWHELGPEDRRRLAHEHACRVALVLAAAAFSAGMKISRCSVEVDAPRCSAISGSKSSFTLLFERSHFLSVYAPLAGTLMRQPLLNGVCSRILEFERGPSALPVGGADPRWVAIQDDDRPLPPALQKLLLADRMCELNVMEPESSPSMQRLSEIEPLVAASPARAEQELVGLVSELEAACAVAELQSDLPLQSQFCENSLARVLIPLIEDDPRARIHRAPDALFCALNELAVLYVNMGAYEQALGTARQMVDLAATSPQAHFTLVTVLCKLGRYRDVVEVCLHGMRSAHDRTSIAYYYYRLAFAYWALGDLKTALACYRLVGLGHPISDAARAEMHALMGKLHRQDAPSRAEAEAIVQLAGVPICPVPEVSDQVANAAVLLADNGFFPLAQGCIIYMWRVMGDDELGAVSRSLQPLPLIEANQV